MRALKKSVAMSFESSSSRFEVTVLGSGTSTGVPVIGCSCQVCKSSSRYNKRMRSSLFISDKEKQRDILIDTTPDLRFQLLNNNLSNCDYLLFTHTHADHCHGLDDLRPLFFHGKKNINVWAHEEHEKELKSRFHYIFEETGYMGLKPSLSFISLKEIQKDFSDVGFETMTLPHGSTFTSLFKLGSFVYVTDFKAFSPEQIQSLKGKVKTMVASAPTYKPHQTHSCIPETVALFKTLGVEKGYLTHLSHQIDHTPHSETLPEGVFFAYDGLKIQV